MHRTKTATELPSRLRERRRPDHRQPKLCLWRARRAAEPAAGLRIAFLLIFFFTALGLVSRLLCEDSLGESSFWPANAAIVVAGITLPARLSLATALACFGLNLALNFLTEYTLWESLLFSSLNISVGYVAACLTRSQCGAASDLTRFRRIVTFSWISFASAGLEASFGEALLFRQSPIGIVQSWFQWTLCDGLGLLLGTPAILMIVKSIGSQTLGNAGHFERRCLLVVTVSLTAAAFSLSRSPLFLLLYPLLVTIAFRAGPAWVLTSVLLISVIASALTAHGYGPIVWLSPSGHLLSQDMLQPYLVSLFLVAVPANSALGEMARTAARLKQTKSNLQLAATHDALTSLMNRDLFQLRMAASRRAGTDCAVIFVDLDRFKQVNDTFGHPAGDELLRLFSSRLRSLAKSVGAIVARFGGDEFALLLENNTGRAEIDSLCEAISSASRVPYPLRPGPAHVTVSIGVALAVDDNSEELMRKADIALYAAKAAGRDGCCVFTEELDLAVRNRAKLEAELRSAIDGAGSIFLHYQVKVDLMGQAKGVEALVRWQSPTLGMISPDVFIKIAEETGLIVPLGSWVFREAVAFAERWPQLSVAVNVSPAQLRHVEFATETLAILQTSSVSADRIELEVTETALFEDFHLAAQSLKVLRAAGLGIALDDFGTGFSSLRHLHRFEVDRVKIDQTFVRSLGEGSEPAAIVQAIIQLAHAMGIKVTAEGVETEGQRAFLAASGIDELQGFLFAHPTAEPELAATISRLSGNQCWETPTKSLLHSSLETDPASCALSLPAVGSCD